MKRLVCYCLALLLVLAGLPVWAWEATLETPVVIYGDITGEGKVNAKDALLVLKYAVGKPEGSLANASSEAFAIADVNEDGTVNARDALEILKKSVRKPVDFPNTLHVGTSKNSVRVGTLFPSYYDPTHTSNAVGVFEKLASHKGIGTYVEPMDSFDIVNDIKTGKNQYDLLELTPAMALELAKRGVFVNLKTVSSLDLSLFHPMATEYLTFGENLYGVSTKATVNDPYLVFYNASLAKEVAPEWDIPSLVAQKKWRTDSFFEFLRKGKLVSQVDGKDRVVRCGIADGGWAFYPLLVAQTGPLGVRGKDDSFTITAYDQMMPAASQLRGLFRNSDWWTLSNADKALDSFAQGAALCMIAPASKASVIMKTTNFQVDIAPIPLGEGQEQYRSVHANPRVFVIPGNRQQRLDSIALWLNTLAQYYGTFVNAQIAEFLRLGASPQMADVYKQLLEHSVWDYGIYSSDTAEHFDRSRESFFFTVKSFYGAVERYQHALQIQTQEFYQPLLN